MRQADESGQGKRLAIELAAAGKDFTALSVVERRQYYEQICGDLGINPTTQPIKFITFQNRLVPYVTRDATDQLAHRHGVSREIIAGPEVRDYGGTKILYALCRATLPSGRVETATALVPLPSAGGAEAVANAIMKTETKARRRATLAILGLGYLDESELDTMAGARRVAMADALGGDPASPDDVPAWHQAIRDDIATLGGGPLTVEQAAALWTTRRPDGCAVEESAYAWRDLLAATVNPGRNASAVKRACELLVHGAPSIDSDDP